MNYVDGFVLAVPSSNKEEYQQYAVEAAEVFKRHGALRVVECWGDSVPDGKLTSFVKAVQCEESESVVFSWIEWPSKELRDSAMEVLINDPWFNEEMDRIPFDGKRLILGGFQTIMDA